VVDALSVAAPTLAAGDAARVYPTRGVHGRVVEQIGRRILGGELAPGAMLPREAELVRELGISRTAVREAIKVLAAKGLVESRQRLGMRVRPEAAWNLLDPDVLAWQAASGESPEWTAHVAELRQMIEPTAARLAAGRRGPIELAALDAALAAMQAAADDPRAFHRADLAFHRAVFAASGNPFVDRLGAIVSAVCEVSFRLQRRSLRPVALGLAMHEQVLDAVRRGDADAAERAMHGIIEEARVELAHATAAGDRA
jgi:DNA-binding FadR family transcriptional regulator